MSKLSNVDARKALAESHEILARLNQRIIEEAPQAVLPGYADYAKKAPSVLLERAGKKLRKSGYKVAFAGAMKAGKSTLINALLKSPALLPAEVFECTLSTTLVSAPGAGQQERVEVSYFAKDDAIRNVLGNKRYEKIFADVGPVLRDYEAGRALSYVAGKVAEHKKSSGLAEQTHELAEFCEAITTYSSRLNTTHVDALSNAPRYLTVDREKRGMGHLLLIRQVAIFKSNPVFAESGIDVVDLPGTDSTNPRQKELTHAFMEEADAVFLVLEPRGFTSAAQEIANKVKEFNQEVRNKLFVVINRWDTLQTSNLQKEPLETLFQNDIKKRMIDWGLRPDRVFLTSALGEELRLKDAQRSITDLERGTLQKLEREARDNLASLDPRIADDLLALLKQVYADGGASYLRREMSTFLQEDIERERLRDVYLDLEQVYDLARALLDPERAAVQQLLVEARNRLVQVGRFVDELADRYSKCVEAVEAKLDKAVLHFLQQAKSNIAEQIQRLVEADGPELSLRRIHAGMAVPTPARIKSEAIAKAKEAVATRFVKAIEGACVRPIVDKLLADVSKLNNERIFAHFDNYLKGGNFKARYEQILKRLDDNVTNIAKLRAQEEAWELVATDMQPAGAEGAWTDAIASEFRNTLKQVFLERANVHAKRLETALWRYYRHFLSESIAEFAKLCSQVSDAARHVQSVPLPNLKSDSGKVDRQQLVIDYLTDLDELSPRLAGAAPTFGKDAAKFAASAVASATASASTFDWAR